MMILRIICLCVLMTTNWAIADLKLSNYDVNAAVRLSQSNALHSDANVMASSHEKTLDVLGFWFVNSGLSQDNDVLVMRMAFNNFLFDSGDGTIVVNDINLLGDVAPELLGAPLFFPNPFKFSEGGRLQYTLSQPMDIQIHMYDMFGRRIYKKSCAAYSSCGQADINRIEFNQDELDGYQLSAGVYFYIFI